MVSVSTLNVEQVEWIWWHGVSWSGEVWHTRV